MKDNKLPLFPDFTDQNLDNIITICSALGVDPQRPGWPDLLGEKLFQYLKINNIPTIRTLSLFSGAGGLDIGFHDLGFDIVNSVEIEEKFCETLKMNSGEGRFFQNSTVNCIDIRKFSGDELGKIDWIIGGPPCQTFSAAGRRASGVLGTTDERGVLFKEYVRLLKKLQPKGFLFENVYGIIGAQQGEPWKQIIKAFSDAGYKLFFRILDAADYGVPQHRERLIIIGLKEGHFLFPRPTNGPDSVGNAPFYTAGLAVDGLKLSQEESKPGIKGKYGYLLDDIPPGLNYSFYTSEMGHPHPIFAWRSKFSDFLYKADPDTPVRTIKASGGQYTGPLSWHNRYFSYNEFKRLQTFPDKYNISGTKQIAVKQIGNSVPPQLARMLALAIRIQIFKTQFPFTMATLDENQELSFRKRKRELTKAYQNKAKAALETASNTKVEVNKSSENFYLTIGNRFEYTTSQTEGTYSVKNKWLENLLHIEVSPTNVSSNDKFIKISIIPKRAWTLPIERIELSVKNSNSWEVLTAAWKVLDKELLFKGLKADLIQLNGYYQNESSLLISLETNASTDTTIFEKIIQGICTQRNLKTQELAEIWDIPQELVRTKALYLKTIGYEIRNKNTNPQMNDDEWLIPYKFPTLVPQSVQLYKKL